LLHAHFWLRAQNEDHELVTRTKRVVEHPAAAGLLPIESQLRLAIDTIPGLVWTARPDGHIDFLNQRWLDYTGLTLDEASGWDWQVAVHPADLPGLLDYWKSLLAAGTPGETEARLRSVDGQHRWFLFRGVPLYDEQGRVVKWYGQTTDIEDRKRAEALLTGEKRLLEMVARGRPLGEILTALCRFVETTAPGCHCSILQFDSEKRRLHSIAAPSLPASYTDFVDGIGGTCGGPCGMAAQLNQQVIAADIESDERWQASGWRTLALTHRLRACWSTPIRAFGGNVLGTFAVSFTEPGQPTEYHKSLIDQFTDLASIAIERSRKEEKLRRSEAYLAEAQRLSQTGSFSWRPANGDIVWSEQTYRIYELDPSIKPTIALALARVHPEDVPVFEEAVQRAMTGGDDLNFEHRLLLPNGDIKYLHVVARAETGLDGEPVEFVGAVRDVTDLKVRQTALHRVRAELAHVSRVATVGALTASIAHEVNQPLSGIVTNASVCMRALAAQPPEIQAASEAAKRAIRDANRAAEVITRLRALFRKKNVAREPFDLNDAIHEVLALATSEIQRSKTGVRTALADELPSVLGDRTQVQQVVLNLVLNSLEAMNGVEAGQRKLVIETRVDAGNVRTEVRDRGTGLDAQNVERVFDPFFTTKNGGMGMGLSISRSIIESHQGRLWAADSGGVGATFAFTLPLVPAE
jgi:PAS domain S-box-containing protein